MRILAIRGENLASLQQPFCVDFRVEPLRDAGLYAITGPTGAGKSTILDALCVALYNQIPRLRGEKGEGVLDASGDTIKPTDPVNLLRRGACSCSASVDFVGIDGLEYSASWGVRRAKNQPDGKLQHATMSFIRLHDKQELASSTTECRRLVEEKLGLNYAQFTRTVLLAQREFDNFLNADSNEKATLLERITGSEIYAQISEQIHLLYGEAKEAYLRKKEELAPLLNVTEESVQNQRDALASLTEERAVQLVQIDRLGKNEEKRRRMQAISRDYAAAQGELTQAESDWKLLQASKQILAQWNEAQQVAPICHQLYDLRKRKADYESRLEQLALDLGQAEKDAQIAEKSLEALELEQSEQEGRIARTREAMVRAATIQKQVDALELSERRLCAEAAEQEKQLKRALSVAQEAENGLATLRNNRKKTSLELAQLKKDESLYLVATAVIPLLESLRTAWEDEVKATTQRRQAQLEEKELTVQIEALEHQLQELRGAVSPEIFKLRQRLEDGAPCPVCGSIHHPIIQESAGSARVMKGDIASLISSVEAQLGGLTARMGECQQKIQQASSSVDLYTQQHSKWLEKIRALLGEPVVAGWKRTEDLAAWQKSFVSNSQRWQLLRTQDEADAQQEKTQSITADYLQKELQSKEKLFRAHSEKLENLRAELKTRREEVSAELRGKTPETLERTIASVKRDMQEKLVQQKGEVAHRSERKVSLTTQLTQTKRVHGQCIAEEGEVLTRLQDWCATSTLFTDTSELLGVLQQSREAMQRLQERWQAASEKMLLASTKLQTLGIQQAQMAQELVDIPELEIIRAEQLSVNALLAKLNKEIGVREGNLKLAETNLEQQRQILAQLPALENDNRAWADLESLLGSASGKKFRTIAQRYTFDLLIAYANEHLQRIMPRYKLERMQQGSLALQIVDAEMLNEVRPVHTLSGGESFLVSLSLSLALSSISSSSQEVGSLFIDEGFGSLDPDTLGVALQALENLQLQGKQIGLISHVQDLNERIPVKVRITPQGGGTSSVSVQVG